MSHVFDAYAAYYDLLYRDKDYAGEATFVRDLLCLQGVESGDILELGCGTGKHALNLVQMGYRMQGVDVSPAMVAAARSHLPVALSKQITFEEGDVRSVRLEKKFGAVISLFHVASYQTSNDDIAAMFQTAAQHLNAGGVFLFDCWYGPAVLTERPAIRVKRLEDESVSVLRIAEPVMHPNDNCVDVNYTMLVTPTDSQQTKIIRESHRMRYFFVPELRLLLAEAGFELVSKVEWMSGCEPGFSTWSIAIVAVRN